MSFINMTLLNDKRALVALTLILTSTAIYVFPPGYPQPGHVAAVLLMIPLFLSLNSLKLELPERLLIGFWVYVCIVNATYGFIHGDFSFVISIVYWTYGLVLFFSARQIMRASPKLGVALPWSLLIMLPVLLVLALFGGDGLYRDDRFFGTFTDPNQMSYWILCLFVGSLLLQPKPRWLGPSAAVVVFGVISALFVLSSSRSAMLAAVVFLAGLVWWWLECAHSNRKQDALGVDSETRSVSELKAASEKLPVTRILLVFFGTVLLALVVLAVLYLSSDGVRAIIENLVERSQTYGLLWQLEVRGYMRLLEFPRYLIFGAGQGFDGRFMEPFDGNVIYEVHSSLIAPLFYYGIIGFGLLYTSFYLIARDRLVGWQWLVFAAPFVYGLFTYGLRTPIFWIMLASLYTITPRHRQRVSD